MRRLLASLGLASALMGCEASPIPPPAPIETSAATSGSEEVVAAAPVPLRLRGGQALVRGLDEAALYVADEDQRWRCRDGPRLFSGFPKYGLVADTLISEQWLDGDPAPMITVLGVL